MPLFEIEILDEPDSRGYSRVLERRAHTGATVDDALRSAKANLRSPSAGAYSFSMKMRGKEVARWKASETYPSVRGKQMWGKPSAFKKNIDEE